jgi:hypothetical protein
MDSTGCEISSKCDKIGVLTDFVLIIVVHDESCWQAETRSRRLHNYRTRPYVITDADSFVMSWRPAHK